MCGIAGFFARNADALGSDAKGMLQRMQAAMLHRGPDGRGSWLDDRGRAGLAHARLAIIDTSIGGAQPMATPDGRHVISFNGEIYNYRSLRAELASTGSQFESDSDTEVILQLLQRDGAAGLQRLRGMFALALWDCEAQRGLLARDGLGIKPLYYATTGFGLVFASELRTLLASSAVPLVLDPSAVFGYFATGSVPEPDTLVQNVKMLGPGQFLQWSAGRNDAGTFWKVEFPEPTVTDAADATARTRAALEDSVAAHLVSDVPIGLFLSGGIDSNAILALIAGRGAAAGMAAFSIGVDEPGFDEAGVAAASAAHFGVSHHVLRLDAMRAQDSLSGFMTAMDVPSVDGFNTWTVSQLARSHGYKVVLSGLGGDELFGGYPSFVQVPRIFDAMQSMARAPQLARALGAVATRFPLSPRMQRAVELLRPGMDLSDAYRAYRGTFPVADAARLAAHYTGCLEGDILRDIPGRQELASVSTGDRVSYLEITRYMRNQLLRDSDVMSMAHGLELRLPLVDQRLFDAVAVIPASLRLRAGKQMLLDAVPEIPARVIHAPKRGFSFPMQTWLQREMGPEFRKAAAGMPVKATQWYQLWTLLALGRWLEARGVATSGRIAGSPG
ncbi:MAG: asparagine synthase (glutamine-hydrolyzing) [Frankiaceae bacterium]|nr:asparagine synthase (glutamine-hydrolyzing) [Arenimonas sp.]